MGVSASTAFACLKTGGKSNAAPLRAEGGSALLTAGQMSGWGTSALEDGGNRGKYVGCRLLLISVFADVLQLRHNFEVPHDFV